VNHLDRWFQRTDLNMMLSLEDLTETRLLSAMDFLEETDREKLQRDLFQSVKEKYHLKDSGVIYDVTNTYLYGKKCLLGKLGHDKEGVKGRPLIQIGLGVTKDEGIPVFHKTFDGNIHPTFRGSRGAVSDLIPQQLRRFQPDRLHGVRLFGSLVHCFRHGV
jgi:transposase